MRLGGGGIEIRTERREDPVRAVHMERFRHYPLHLVTLSTKTVRLANIYHIQPLEPELSVELNSNDFVSLTHSDDVALLLKGETNQLCPMKMGFTIISKPVMDNVLTVTSWSFPLGSLFLVQTLDRKWFVVMEAPYTYGRKLIEYTFGSKPVERKWKEKLNFVQLHGSSLFRWGTTQNGQLYVELNSSETKVYSLYDWMSGNTLVVQRVAYSWQMCLFLVLTDNGELYWGNLDAHPFHLIHIDDGIVPPCHICHIEAWRGLFFVTCYGGERALFGHRTHPDFHFLPDTKSRWFWYPLPSCPVGETENVIYNLESWC